MKSGLRTMTSEPSFTAREPLKLVKKFGWPPDIIHCSGWMTGLIPAYLKQFIKGTGICPQ